MFRHFFPHSSLCPVFLPFLKHVFPGHHHLSQGTWLCPARGPGYQNLLLKVYSQVLSKDNGMHHVFKWRLPELHPPQTCHIAFESLHRIELFNKLILMNNIVSLLWNIVEQRFKAIVSKGIICMHTQTISMLFCSVLRIHKIFLLEKKILFTTWPVFVTPENSWNFELFCKRSELILTAVTM